jgi:hypothetical protein
MRTTKALVLGAASAALAAGVTLGIGSPAGAGKPRVQACVGQSLSALASNQQAPGDFGAGVRGFAQDPLLPPPGLGDGLQALQAGLVPDEAVPNTCNVD